MTVGVYYIKNLFNGKIYIGSSAQLSTRRVQHFRALHKGTHINSHLQAAYNKYGKDSFEFAIIEELDKQVLLAREQYWMDYYQSYNTKHGYNIKPTANHSIHSEETKHKIGLSNIGKHSLFGAANCFYGHKHSEATRTIISQKAKERFKDKTKNPMYGVHLVGEKNGMFGRCHSAKSRAKMGKPATVEMRRKMREAWVRRKEKSAEAV